MYRATNSSKVAKQKVTVYYKKYIIKTLIKHPFQEKLLIID